MGDSSRHLRLEPVLAPSHTRTPPSSTKRPHAKDGPILDPKRAKATHGCDMDSPPPSSSDPESSFSSSTDSDEEDATK